MKERLPWFLKIGCQKAERLSEKVKKNIPLNDEERKDLIYLLKEGHTDIRETAKALGKNNITCEDILKVRYSTWYNE